MNVMLGIYMDKIMSLVVNVVVWRMPTIKLW